MARPRGNRLPYLWASWITSLLAGSASCEYAPWFQSRFYFDKVERDFNLVAWTAEHAGLVRERAHELEASGYRVWLEDQNKFTLRGRAAVLAGKPDIVARKDRAVLIVDGKTGKPKDSDVWQVLLYLFALPLVGHAALAMGEYQLFGELRYRGGVTGIGPGDFTPAIRERIVTLITRLGESSPPPKVPSFAECSWCAIPKSECPERVEVDPAVVETSAF